MRWMLSCICARVPGMRSGLFFIGPDDLTIGHIKRTPVIDTQYWGKLFFTVTCDDSLLLVFEGADDIEMKITDNLASCLISRHYELDTRLIATRYVRGALHVPHNTRALLTMEGLPCAF